MESFETAAPAQPPTYRTLPHSIEAEEFLLSCCLLDGADTLGKCILQKIGPASFYEQKHAIVFATMVGLYVQNKPIDVATVAEELRTQRQLDSVGGYPFLVQISSQVPTTANVAYFIAKVVEMATLRAVIRAGTNIVEGAYAFSGDLTDFISNSEQTMFSATRELMPEQERTWSGAIDDAKAKVQAIIAGREDGIMTFGLNDLDAIFAKGRPGELIVLAARPSVGKSSLARMIAEANARAGLVVQVNSLEVSSEEIALQMAASKSGIPMREVGRAHERDQRCFGEALESLRLPNLHVYDTDYTLSRICARARALRPKVIVIDYLTLIEDCSATGSGTKAQAIGAVTRALKQLARELGAVIVLLAQLNRGPVLQGGREPTLADLRDSGDIEQDADRVIFLHVPTADPLTGTRQSSEADPQDVPTLFVSAIQAKGRNVGCGIVSLYFRRAIATFQQIARRAA